MGRVVSVQPFPIRKVSDTPILIHKLVWDDGGLSFEVYRMDGDDAIDLTENGCFDHEPTDEEIQRLLEFTTNSSEEVTWDLGGLVKGQGQVTACGCGEYITWFRGEWMHVLNPKLTGADDHWAQPGDEREEYDDDV